MAYSTLTDILKVIPEVTVIQLTDDVAANSVDEAKVDEAIALADGEIDTYVGVKYPVPLTAPVPAIIRGISCDITIYKIYKRRLEEVPETRETSYRDAVKLLKEIRDGKMPLPIADVDPAASFASGVLVTSHFGSTSTIGGLETR
jgi:phage gp36-like protein